MARRIKATGPPLGPTRALARTAVVFKRPLPYVYLATTVFGAAGIEYQASDALPLAAEPFAAVLDLVCVGVESRFSRRALLALMRSPHVEADPAGEPLSAADVDAFDRGLVEARYLGDPQALASLAARWNGGGAAAARAAAALVAALAAASDVVDRVSAHASRLFDFLRAHERMAFGDDALRSRHLRARGAVLSAVDGLRQAALAFDDPPARFGEVAATVRRWIESQTFSPRRGAARRPPGRRAGGALRRVRRAAPGRARGGRLARASVAQHLLPGVSPVRARMAVTGRPAGRRDGPRSSISSRCPANRCRSRRSLSKTTPSLGRRR